MKATLWIMDDHLDIEAHSVATTSSLTTKKTEEVEIITLSSEDDESGQSQPQSLKFADGVQSSGSDNALKEPSVSYLVGLQPAPSGQTTLAFNRKIKKRPSATEVYEPVSQSKKHYPSVSSCLNFSPNKSVKCKKPKQFRGDQQDQVKISIRGRRNIDISIAESRKEGKNGYASSSSSSFPSSSSSSFPSSSSSSADKDATYPPSRRISLTTVASASSRDYGYGRNKNDHLYWSSQKSSEIEKQLAVSSSRFSVPRFQEDELLTISNDEVVDADGAPIQLFPLANNVKKENDNEKEKNPPNASSLSINVATSSSSAATGLEKKSTPEKSIIKKEASSKGSGVLPALNRLLESCKVYLPVKEHTFVRQKLLKKYSGLDSTFKTDALSAFIDKRVEHVQLGKDPFLVIKDVLDELRTARTFNITHNKTKMKKEVPENSEVNKELPEEERQATAQFSRSQQVSQVID